MNAVPVGEEQQPEEKEKYSQPDVESGGAAEAAVETVASTEFTDSRKEAASDEKDDEKGNAVPQGSGGTVGLKLNQSTDGEDEQLNEQVIELDSSPEKMLTLTETKEDSLKSPVLEVLSIDDEEEEPDEEEGREEEEEMDEEEDYEDMDEDYEVYVEEKESANPHNSMDDDDGSKLDISTDEYTDEDAEQSPEKMEAKSASTPRRKSPSTDREQGNDDEEEEEEHEQEEEEDDDDVQIISYDEDIEEEDEEFEEEDEDDDDDSMRDEEEEEEEENGGEGHGKRKVGYTRVKAKSDPGGRFGFGGFPKTFVKYRSFKLKQVASIRKRTIRILNRGSMHVMDHNDDARAVSSDCKVIKAPRATDLKSVYAPAKSPGHAAILREEIYGSSSITSTDSQNEQTKDTGITTAGGDNEHPVVPAKLTEAVEKSSNTISSTTPASNTDDKMPTATAVEVSEKIADSSDDAVSVLSSSTSAKKSVTAITPTVNSSASTEAVDQKPKATVDTGTTDPPPSKASDADRDASSRKESATTGSLQDELSKQENNSTNTQKGDVNVPSEKKQTSPSPTGLAEPTADDVMAGVDDLMDHNGSEGDEEDKQQEFNDDLTFQMDVDAPVEGSVKREESAIDLTSVTEQSSKSQKPEESASSEKRPTDSGSEPAGKESGASSASVAVSSSKDGNLDMHDKTVVTSTPVTSQKKGQQKRADREREQETASSSSSLEVKQEHEEQPDVNEAQNLSKQKPALSRDDGAQKTVQSETVPQQPTASRKRRRSVANEEDRQSSAGRAEQDPEESIEPAKKLKLEVEANYQTHERVVNEYIDTTQNTSVNEIQSHTDALVKEIQELNDMIRETETKWNNLLHLKKVKEEILLRLNRRKHVIGIMDTQLGEVSVYSHLDSSNLSSQHHHHQQSGRSSSVGPRPPTPPPEVEIRPASVTSSMHYGFGASNSAGTASNGGDKASGSTHFANSLISNRRSSSNSVQPTSANSAHKASRAAKDANSFVSQFNSSNNAVTMVPLPNTTSMILNARASMNTVEVAKEKSAAVQIQRQILSKPILSNHQQILNNLAMSAGLTGSSSAANNGGSGNSNSSNSALLNGHHSSGTLTANQQQQLQIGRQGMRKEVSSIIADYRQKHPENVPRRGRRLKNVGGSSSSSSNSVNNNGTSGGNSLGSFGEGGAISLTALTGGKSPANARPNSTDSVANRISELLAAAETSRPSSNDSSQSSSNLLTSLMSASGAAHSSQQFFKDVLAQFAKMSQNEQSLLSNLQLLSSNATSGATNTVSSPQQSPQQQQHHQQHHHQAGNLHQQQSSLLSKASLPEVTLHPVMNSTAHSDVLGGNVSHGNGSLTGANLSAVNNSTNSLLHGILTKSANRPGQTASAAAAAAAAVGNFNTFSPTLARLLTVPERMNSQSSSTVTSGALATLQNNSLTGGLNLSKNINEISITPVVGSNFQQTLLAQQQQQQTLQRLREQQLYNLDDEADDSADRLVIDEGDDMGHRDSGALHGGKRRGAEINENEVPQCQGCKKQEAKFVCAGCSNQWYCSRACQVNAWDDHSEVCSG